MTASKTNKGKKRRRRSKQHTLSFYLPCDKRGLGIFDKLMLAAHKVGYSPIPLPHRVQLVLSGSPNNEGPEDPDVVELLEKIRFHYGQFPNVELDEDGNLKQFSMGFACALELWEQGIKILLPYVNAAIDATCYVYDSDAGKPIPFPEWREKNPDATVHDVLTIGESGGMHGANPTLPLRGATFHFGRDKEPDGDAYILGQPIASLVPKEEIFKAPRSVIQGANLLSKHDAQRELFNNGMTAYQIRLVMGLTSLTDNKDPHKPQDIKVGDLLDVIHVSHGTEAPMNRSGRDYRDALDALAELFSMSIPLARREKRDGKWRNSFVVGRILQEFGLVYLDKNRKPILYSDVPDVLKTDLMQRESRKKVYNIPKKDPLELRAIYEWDAEGNVKLDEDGNPSIRRPNYYQFRFATSIADDLAGKNHGFLLASKNIFPVLKDLAKNKLASTLFLLLIHDIERTMEPKHVIERSYAHYVKHLTLQGPPNKIKRDLKTAFQRIKEAGVLTQDSDEEPRTDPNQERRQGPYYRLKFTDEWKYLSDVNYLAPEDRPQVTKAEFAERIRKKPKGKAKATTAPPKPDPDLFGNVDPPEPSGTDILAARKAVGMDLRQFADQFGKNKSFWSKVEREEAQARTGRPPEIPVEFRDKINAFIHKHLGAEGRKE